MDGAIGIEPAADAGNGGHADAEPVIEVAGRYRLLPWRRIPSLDSPNAKAYEALDTQAPAASLFCLISPLEALPRVALAQELVASPLDGVLTPYAAEYCMWPPLGRAAAAFVFQQPGGARLTSGSGAGLSTAELSRRVLEPLARALAGLEARGITHRGIRADNLFWADRDETEILFGECVSAAAGSDQPALYEPLHRMAAMPVGRGAGKPADDLYATGVMLIDLLYGLRNENGYPAGLVFRKLEQGTLSTLLPQVSPAPELASLLRGLLTDDVQWRWTPRHLSRWLAGERVDPPSPAAQITAQRGLTLGKARFRSPRALAYGFSREPELAVSLLRDGTVEQWLRVSVRDERLASLVAREVKEAAKRRGRRNLMRNLLIQRCCQLLDPDGPIRFGAIAVMPEACGTALASLLLKGQDTSEFQSLLRSLSAGDLSPGLAQDAGADAKLAAGVKLLNAGGPGGGLARCVYELNPDLPCISPNLPVPAADVRSLLEALDTRALDLPAGSSLTDPQVAAFIGNRLDLQPLQLLGVAGNRGPRSSEAQNELRMLALAQAYRGPSSLPALARAAAVRLSPVIRSVQNRAERKRLAAAVAECVERGDLATMVARIDDIGIWERDRTGFARAQREFAVCAREIERLRDPVRSGLAEALQEGQKIAAVLSLSLAVAIVCSAFAIS